ncbi:MAG TPA: purine-nucleoside phosphorylase [Bryobacteraceae bacterium]|nr:purine-nucleoside phosphorylase [Bryobacteraceae bacterium]
MQPAVAYIRDVTVREPRMVVVLGSGLGAFADELDDPISIPYSEIPGWPVSTAVGHAGKLVFGKLGHLDIAVMAGRAHLYEGYTPAQVTMGVRVLHRLGARSIVLTNAAGGINLSYRQGALVLISDHINLQGLNPLIGINDESEGPRFPDMTEAYSAAYRAKAHQVAQQLKIHLDEGVYAALTGPSYETPAEIRYLRAIGADLVGMSTVPEVIVANHLRMQVLGISCVTNMAAGVSPQKLDHKEVMETGYRVRDTLIRFLKALLPKL